MLGFHGQLAKPILAIGWVVLTLIHLPTSTPAQVLPIAPATPNEAAGRIMAERAEQDVRSRRYESAIDGFRQAFEAAGDPANLYNIGLLYLSRLKKPLLAHAYALRYRELAQSANDRTDAMRLIADIEEVLAATHGHLVVTPSSPAVELWVDRKNESSRLIFLDAWLPPGEHVLLSEAAGFEPERIPFHLKKGFKTEILLTLRPTPAVLRVESRTASLAVSIDGVYEGPTPIERPVVPGEHAIRAEAPGFAPFGQKVRLGPGEMLVVHADLIPLTNGQETVQPTPPVMPASASSKGSAMRTAAWVTMASGVAITATGGLLYGLAYKDYQDADDMERASYATNEAFDEAFDAKVDAGKKKALASYVLWGVGGAALATGLVLYFTAPDDTATVLIPAGPTGLGLTAHVAW